MVKKQTVAIARSGRVVALVMPTGYSFSRNGAMGVEQMLQ